MKNFDDMLPDDREFVVGGETFHWRQVRPEVLQAFEPPKDEENVWAILDAQILLFVAPEDHERWLTVRKQDEKAVTGAQIQAIIMWLVEVQTELPTVQPSPSVVGRGQTAVTSKAA